MINGKLLVHLRAPVLTQSGYGAHAREVFDYLASDDKFIIALESINWGNCGFINEKNFSDSTKIKKYYHSIAIWEQVKDKEKFDIGIHVTIPNEFARTAQINIGVTAGIETDRVAVEWIKKCNEMDIIVVPSTHSANVLHSTVYQKKNQNGEIQEEHRVIKPIYIINEYFEKPKEIKPLNLKFSTDKNLLCVGLWGGKGGFGEDRKNIADLVKLFITQNKDNPKVGLILKTQLVNGSAKDREETIKRINEIKSNFSNIKCKIHLVHQELTEEEMWGLYSHPQVTGVISLTHGEGFGRPLLEAAACGKPILATNWSGHLDFLRKEGGFLPIDYEMVQVPECQIWDGVITKESRWAKVYDYMALKRMSKFLEGPKEIQVKAENNIAWLEENFGKESSRKKWRNFFAEFIKEAEEKLPEDVPDEFIEHKRRVAIGADILRKMIDTESKKEKVLYVIPQSAGDCLISTAIINSLILNRHLDTESDFYVATSPQFKLLFSQLEKEFGVKVINYNHNLMFDSEILREVFDVVYTPGINIQFKFSNWLLGNGDYSVRLLEEFAKNCNLSPRELRKYKVEVTPCKLPDGPYVVIGPGGQKSAKMYRYWPDVVENIKLMIPNVEIVQVGAPDEDLLGGVLDYRGKEYSESFYVIKNALMFVGCDSFPAHAAAAMNTPHLVIYGSTHAATCSPVLLDKNVPQLAIETEKCNPRCYKDQCMKVVDGKNCLSYINPSTICSGIKSILEKVLEKAEKPKNEDAQQVSVN